MTKLTNSPMDSIYYKVFVLIFIHGVTLGASSNPRLRSAEQEKRLQSGNVKTTVSKSIGTDDPCFGVDGLKGFWNNRTRRFVSSTCDVEPLRYGLFDDESTASRVRLAQCFSNRRWVVLMGDSNSRGIFNIVCDLLSTVVGAQNVYRFGGDDTNQHGDSRWSDREFIFPGSKTVGPFRFSFRFYSSYDKFKLHVADKFEQDFEHDNTLEKQQARGSLFERYVVPENNGWPSVLLLSSGLWKLKCQTIQDTYETLNEKLQSSIKNILFFPPAHLLKHPTISNSMIEGIHKCLIEKRNKELIDFMDRQSFFKNSAEGKPGIVPIFDAYKLTEKMPLSWINGFHFAGSWRNPVAQAVISYLLKFTCR